MSSRQHSIVAMASSGVSYPSYTDSFSRLCHGRLTLSPLFPHSYPLFRSFSIKRNPRKSSSICLVQPRAFLKSKQQSNSKPSVPRQIPSSSTTFDFPSLLRLGDAFKVDELAMDVLSIALPAALALAADPVTSLVDTAFVGHLGATELAAVGVSVSVFNLVSKLFNVPLLNVTTSFVAEEQASISMHKEDSVQTSIDHGERRKPLPSVSTSLILAVGLGLAETVALSVGSGLLMDIMGISVDSPMRQPAEEFLRMRAFGAPAIVVALAAQGTFRGFKDTKTPLYAIVAGNLLNAILDPILIFFFGFGIGGAATATVISEYLIAGVLLWKLNEEVSLVAPNIDGGRFLQYLTPGGLLTGRTLSVLMPLTLATSMAAREGPVSMAGYQICVEVWMSISLLTDALALAGQALLAGDYSQGQYAQARQVVYRVLQIGLVMGIGLAVILFLGFEAIAGLFSTDVEVLKVAWSGDLFVAGSQPMNAIAFVFDGIYYGVSDFEYAAYSTVAAALVSSIFLLIAAPIFGLPGVWAGLFLFMTLRALAGIWRLATSSGPWLRVWSEMD